MTTQDRPAPESHAPSTEVRLEELQEKLDQARAGGGPERIERQHATGKMTAHERIELLLDPGSFVEIDALAPRERIAEHDHARDAGRAR